jgi:hypothetical protein
MGAAASKAMQRGEKLSMDKGQRGSGHAKELISKGVILK